MLKALFLCLAIIAGSSGAAHADSVTVPLGDTARVTHLFSYPNNCRVVCYLPWTLEETVEHYIGQSVKRDGYTDATVDVAESEGKVSLTLTGVPASYSNRITAFLSAGDEAFSGANTLNSDKKWQYDWYFFLPLGMAIENHRSVELLHFPPDYSLTEAQDYLESATTNRWAELLTVNGIAADETPRYQTIIDIAPIAAPASAGSELEGTYAYFDDYHNSIIDLWTKIDDSSSYPMVAFGSPVRKWIKTEYGLQIGVLGLGEIALASGRDVNVLGSNHPSYIWYASDPDNYGGSEQKADAAGIQVMSEDIVAACWQARMGEEPASSAADNLSQCQSYWQKHSEDVCERFYIKIRELSEPAAKAKCESS